MMDILIFVLPAVVTIVLFFSIEKLWKYISVETYRREKTDDLRIIEEVDGFRIQRKSLIVKTSYLKIRKKIEISWDYESTYLDNNEFFYLKPKSFETLEQAKIVLDKLNCTPKYHY